MKFPEEKRYLKIHEVGLYSMAKDRNLKLDEMMLSVYLRGKFLRFNMNPFYLKDSIVIDELNISRNTLRRIRNILKTKALIKFTPGLGVKNHTTYTMLDTYMATSRDGINQKGSSTTPLKGSAATPFHNVLNRKNEIKGMERDRNINFKSKRQRTSATPINEVVQRVFQGSAV